MVGNSDDIGEFQFDPTEFEFAWSRIVATRNELLSIGFAGLVSRINDIASTVTLLRSPIVHDVRQRITAAESALRKLQRQITVSGQAQVASKLESAIATSRPMREIFEEVSSSRSDKATGDKIKTPSIFPPGHPDRIASGGTIPIEGSSAAAFTSQIGGDFGGEGTGFVPPPTVPLPTPGTGADTIPPDENASCPVGPGECHTLNFAGAITVRDTTTGALRSIPRCEDAPPIVPPDAPAETPSTVNAAPGTNYCDLGAFLPGSNAAHVTPSNIGDSIRNLLIPSTGDILATLANATFNPFVTNPIQTVGITTQAVLAELLAKLTTEVTALLSGSGVQLGHNVDTYAGRILLSLSSIIAGDVATDLKQPLDYFSHLASPVLYPPINESTAAFLGGSISEPIFDSWVKANNYCLEPWKAVTDSQRTKPNPAELVSMRCKAIISSPQYDKQMRDLGYTRQADRDNIFDNSQIRPPLSELIRYMVRDTADNAIVQQFKLDGEGETAFERKFTGPIRQWAVDQCVPEEVMRHSWRAHWRLPGFNQLSEMLHRLRPGAEGVENPVTIDDVRTAMAQDDVLSFWIPKLLEISFRPLTRIDLRRAFTIGAITKDQVREGYKDLGYDETRANILADFSEKLKNNRVFSHRGIRLWKTEAIGRAEAKAILQTEGFPDDMIETALDQTAKTFRTHTALKRFAAGCIGRNEAKDILIAHGADSGKIIEWLDRVSGCKLSHKAVGLFKSCLITKKEATDRMTADGMLPSTITKLLDDALLAVDASDQKACVDKLCDRFELGEFNEVQLRQQILALGVPLHCVETLVRKCICNLKSKVKEPTAAMLCKWLEQGLIEIDAFITRLTNLGYSQADAINIVVVCVDGINKRAAQAAAKQQKQGKQQQQKEDKEIERDDTKGKKRADAQRKRLAIARKAKERREKQLLKLAVDISGLAEIDLNDALALVVSEKERISLAHLLTIDQTIQTLLMARDAFKGNPEVAFQIHVDEMARLVVDVICEGGETQIPSGNGSPPLPPGPTRERPNP